jgi:hypothetical protein
MRWAFRRLEAMPREVLSNALARCFLAGDQGLEAIIQRVTRMMGHRFSSLNRVAREFVATNVQRPRHNAVARFISRHPTFQLAWSRHAGKLVPVHLPTLPRRMQPAGAAAKWNLPRIETAGELADWFWLDHGELEWFADLHRLSPRTLNAKIRHYHYRVLQKPGGGVRIIEAPKPRLKEMQRQILDEILARVPAHPATHGFVKDRSILTFAAPHAGREMVVRMDLKDFFPSFSLARIQAFFRTLGYPESAADLLGGICTTSTPVSVTGALHPLYSRPHLPQGAPSSPALANLCAYRMDCRLSGLAKSSGAEYTRYADDLAFSGDEEFARAAERFSTHAASVLMEEGFVVHHRKTRLMRPGVRQHLAGLVINERLNVSRRDFDCLKAILTNCVRHGPERQNRDAHPTFRSHLDGRIAFVEQVNPAKGSRLREIFHQIDWL